MIGLLFLSLAILWLALVIYLTIKIPRWCGVVRHAWLLRLLLVPLLLVGPFVDEILGMRQFEALCKERATSIWISPEAEQVKRARRVGSQFTNLAGYWINIESQLASYEDVDTGRTFLRYELLHTTGGRIAGITLLGGKHSCSPKDFSAMNRLNIDKLIQQGERP